MQQPAPWWRTGATTQRLSDEDLEQVTSDEASLRVGCSRSFARGLSSAWSEDSPWTCRVDEANRFV